MDVIVRADKLRAYERELFMKYGFSAEGAAMAADSLVDADLRGVSSHGAIRLPVYCARIERKVVLPDGPLDVVVDFGAVAVVDGHNTLGQISGAKAMRLAIDKAGQFGVAAVGVRNSHHYGTAAYFAEMAADRDMVGFSTTNTNPLMPPVGGLARKVGNNPLSVAVPAGRHRPMLLDMACSTVAQGKLQLAAKKGVPIPLGWATDSEGNPTTDPQKAMAGFLCSVGGPKGFGLAMVLDLLSGPLVGANCGAGVSMLTGVFDRYQNCGHLFIVLDVAKFCDVAAFKGKVDDYIDYVKDCPVNSSVDGVYMPGEMEYGLRDRRLEEGIPLPEKIVGDMKLLAEKAGIDAERYFS